MLPSWPLLTTRYCRHHRHYRAARRCRSNAIAATTTALPATIALPADRVLMLLLR